MASEAGRTEFSLGIVSNAQLHTCFTGSRQQLGNMLRPVHSREGDFAAWKRGGPACRSRAWRSAPWSGFI